MNAKLNTALVAGGAVLVLGFMLFVSITLVFPHIFQPKDTYESQFMLEINRDNFPDNAWREYVTDNLDSNEDGYLSTRERESVSEIGSYDPETFSVEEEGVSNLGISSLKGLEFFPNLESLVAQNNDITTLDISENTALLYIDLRGNPEFQVEYSKNNQEAQVLSQDGYIEIGS